MSTPIDEGPEKLPDAMYEFSPFGYCGVFMPRHVMEKLVKLTHRHMLAVREVLEAHKPELRAAHWSMALTEDKKAAEYVKFVIRGECATDRIRLFTPIQPERREEVFVVDSYDEATSIAQAMIAARKEVQS